MSDYSAQAHFGNYDATTYGWSQGIPPLVPFAFGGTNFGQCARDAHPVFIAVLTELAPLIPGGIDFGPHDDWSFSITDDLPDGSWSMHHRGLAFDLNWNENPMGQYTSNPFAGQRGAIPHAAASQIATKYGCEYGGDWHGTKDFMHFECHLSPSVARTVKPITEDDMSAADVKAINDHIDGKFKGADGKPWPIENLILEVVKPKFAQLETDIAASEARIIAAIKAGKA